MQNKLDSVVGKTHNLVSSTPTDAVSAIIHVVKECKKIEENEASKRAQIRANRDVALAKIKNARQVLEKVVDYTFDERRKVLETQLQAMESALKTGNIEALNTTLNAVSSILQISPIGNIMEMTQKIANNEYTLTLDDEEDESSRGGLSGKPE